LAGKLREIVRQAELRIAQRKAEMEEAQRRSAMQVADADFESDLYAHMGERGKWAIDANRARVAPPDPSGRLYGFYSSPMFPKGARPEGEHYQHIPEGFVDPDTVYVSGVENAKPQVWAHEFRHRAMPNMPEDSNRLLDAYYARSPQEWQKAVRSHQDMLSGQTGEDHDYLLAEELLVKQLTSPLLPVGLNMADAMWGRPEVGPIKDEPRWQKFAYSRPRGLLE
jgi:hypothetical protein